MPQTFTRPESIAPAVPAVLFEKKLLQHIEDTRLFWIKRHGEIVQRAWNELTESERKLLQEAERRALHVQLFLLCSGGVA